MSRLRMFPPDEGGASEVDPWPPAAASHAALRRARKSGRFHGIRKTSLRIFDGTLSGTFSVFTRESAGGSFWRRAPPFNECS